MPRLPRSLLLAVCALLAWSPARADVGVGAKPLPGAEMLFDGTREMLDAKWTYWQGPRFASSLPIKWRIVEDPVDKGTALMTFDPAAPKGRYGAADIVTQPFAGITLIARSEVSPRNVRLHVVLVDLTTPGLSFKLTPPSGSRDTVRQTTLDFLTQEKAQIALNVHFFVPFPSDEVEANVVGFAASQGTVYSPFEAQPVGSAYSDQSYAIMAYAPALNIDEANRVTLVRRDPDGQLFRAALHPPTAFTFSARSSL